MKKEVTSPPFSPGKCVCLNLFFLSSLREQREVTQSCKGIPPRKNTHIRKKTKSISFRDIHRSGDACHKKGFNLQELLLLKKKIIFY